MERARSCKYMRLHVDAFLKFKLHISETASKRRSDIAVLHPRLDLIELTHRVAYLIHLADLREYASAMPVYVI